MEIDEGERLFEKLVIGQSYNDVSFITARICGVCPTAHTLAAIRAVENAFGVTVNDKIKNLRYALEAAQIVQSHALHLFFLVIPDYIKVQNALDLHEKNPRIFKIATELKAVGDRVVEVIGGRTVHPITPTVGGFTSAPTREEVENLITTVRAAQRLATETVDLFAGFRYPYLKREAEYFALSNGKGIDLLGDNLISTEGVNVAASSYQYVIQEVIKSKCSAKHALHDGHGFLVGAIARVNQMKEEEFNSKTKKIIKALGIKLPINNSFKMNLAQAIELLHLLEEIEKRLTDFLWSKNERTRVPFTIKEGVGVGVVEAPRGLLFHMYEFDKNGIVTNCDIVTPTVQNLTNLEDDANEYLKQNKSLTIPKRERELEMLIRAYDPCITCAVH
jgi:coenzyme F420-reducing hydrogenase alpha subunit